MLVSIYPESLLVVKMCLEQKRGWKKKVPGYTRINNFSLEIIKLISV